MNLSVREGVKASLMGRGLVVLSSCIRQLNIRTFLSSIISLRVALLCIFVSLCGEGDAAEADTLHRSRMAAKDRIAFRINVVDWALMSPNFAFDYDIKNTPYEKVSLGLSSKWNWNSKHNFVPSYVYNIFDLRADMRYYWRQQSWIEEHGEQWQKRWIDSQLRFWDRWLTRLRLFRTVDNPRDWLSFYAGPYLSYTSYSMKLSELGRQGNAVGLGATFGVAIPFYGYADGSALDLEFGASVGWHLTHYDRYMTNVESNCYSYVDSRPFHLVYYPIISDLRVALVYRFNSIQNQHKEIDETLHARHKNMYERDTIQNDIYAYNNKISELKYKVDQENKRIREQLKLMAPSDSLYRPVYLNPIVLQRPIPSRFVKDDRDTVPRRENVNTLEDIQDAVIQQVRKDIDSVPGISRSTIDQIFVQRYRFISDDASIKSINRAGLIKDIYVALNNEIANNNKMNTEGSVTVLENYTEEALRIVFLQKREEVNYSIAVGRSALSRNDRIDWENRFKRMGLESDSQRRLRAAAIADSLKSLADSVQNAKLHVDSTLQATPDTTSQALPDSTMKVAADSVMRQAVDSVMPQTTDSVRQAVADTTLNKVAAPVLEEQSNGAATATQETLATPEENTGNAPSAGAGAGSRGVAAPGYVGAESTVGVPMYSSGMVASPLVPQYASAYLFTNTKGTSHEWK